MTPAQRKAGFVRPEPVGTLEEQDDWYQAFALWNAMKRLGCLERAQRLVEQQKEKAA